MKLKELLEKKKYTHTKLGEDLGKSRQNLSYRLKRDIRELKVSFLSDVCNVIGIDLIVKVDGNSIL